MQNSCREVDQEKEHLGVVPRLFTQLNVLKQITSFLQEDPEKDKTGPSTQAQREHS